MARKSANNSPGQFELKENQPGFATRVALGKKKFLWLNNGDVPIVNPKLFPNLPNHTLDVASQDVMKTVYDSGPEWEAMIKSPKDYVAPWGNQ